ncbi:helix-turn-helix domain-containing protein [Rugosimonospora acidiphila]|uniref:Helix-turn-helix domain-containing protein n=2 Tax=Rugosimonospora acidiphila TaxID=556531 RepID=A0ABP9STL0_9ACTN
MAGFGDQANEFREVGLIPHPAVTVIFDFGDEPFIVEDGRGSRQRDRIVAGLAPDGARAQALARSSECLQLRLSPMLAHTALGACGELGGTVVGLDDLWGRDAVRIQERLRAAGSWLERFAIAEAALARRDEAGRAVDPEVAFAWGRLVASRGRLRVEQLVAEIGWSRKRLWSRFRAQVGLTPKRAAQLIRFDHAAHRLAAGHRAAVVAAAGGYADQSHLHRDVMAFTGMTPATIAGSPFLAVDEVAWPLAPSTGG